MVSKVAHILFILKVKTANAKAKILSKLANVYVLLYALLGNDLELLRVVVSSSDRDEDRVAVL